MIVTRPRPAPTQFLLPIIILISSCMIIEASDQPVKLKYQISSNSQLVASNLNLNEADENGIYLLGLFDVHTQLSPREPFKCGPIELEQVGDSSRRPMQNLAAFLWAIEQVNADSSLLPGIKLGSLVLDTCSSFLRTNQQLANLLHNSDDATSKLPNLRQFAAIVADQEDVQSVEATSSMASSLGVLTFVTQSRSTRLNELVKRYQSSSLALATKRLGELGQQDGQQLDERLLLAELLGIGRMMTTTPTEYPQLDPFVSANEDNNEDNDNEDKRLLMIRMLVNNELLADSLASLCDHYKWDLISVLYDGDEPDLMDLHDEFIRQLFLRNTQLALDERLDGGTNTKTKTSEEKLERLLINLCRKAKFGARVVVTLLGVRSARALQFQLHKMRLKLAASSSVTQPEAREQLKQLNSLIWITTADREPYYVMATDSLGLISVAAGSSSLLPEFKSYYDSLPMMQSETFSSTSLVGGKANNVSSSTETTTTKVTTSKNKWWPEYLRAILKRHKSSSSLELTANECTKWLEPSSSPLREKCRSLSLESLIELETTTRQQQQQNETLQRQTQQQQKSGQLKYLAKYLASGWQHNGMSVINSVLAAANGLEALRQSLCPELTTGMCSQMRDLIRTTTTRRTSSLPLHHQDSLVVAQSVVAQSTGNSTQQAPMLSELLYNELVRSTFPLADKQLFSLVDSPPSPPPPPPAPAEVELSNNQVITGVGGTQLDGKVKFYNLRFLRPNLVGFVKFAHFSADGQLSLVASSSSSKSETTMNNQSLINLEPLYYPDNINSFTPSSSNLSIAASAPLAGVVSSCQDASKCLMLTAFIQNNSMSSNANDSTSPLNEEELAEGVNSLFKLDHPLIAQQQQQVDNRAERQVAANTQQQQVRTMRSKWSAAQVWRDSFGEQQPAVNANYSTTRRPTKRRQFEVVVVMALHQHEQMHRTTDSNASPSPCGRLDEGHAFQHLAAFGYGQTQVNNKWRATRSDNNATGEEDDDNERELLVSVIDYCDGDNSMIEARLMDKLASSSEIVALVDFDSRVSKQIDSLLSSSSSSLINNHHYDNLLHLTLAQSPSEQATTTRRSKSLRIDALPSKANEIEALVRMLRQVSNFRLVHLIYAERHEWRDEFVRRANELNICVSKLIWVPEASEQLDKRQEQVELMRQLFAREFYNYNQSSASPNQTPEDDLNSTRVLVVLASHSNEFTNQLILDAASESMLRDYVWITTHEWLSSVEQLVELGNQQQQAHIELPRYLLATKLETTTTSDLNDFKHHLAHLTPAYHEPLPTDWFDEFWQQHFRCRLPLAASSRVGGGNNNFQTICQVNQRLSDGDLFSSIIDDRVPYTLRALESLRVALDNQHRHQHQRRTSRLDASARVQLARDFRVAFDGGVVEENSARLPAYPLVGFHFVHRLLPTAAAAQSVARRANSRQLENNLAGQLVRVGPLWRPSNETTTTSSGVKSSSWLRPRRRIPTNSSSRLDQSQTISASSKERKTIIITPQVNDDEANDNDNDNENDDEQKLIERSLGQLVALKSRCSSAQTCTLCKQQIEQTRALIAQQEARLHLQADSALPAAVALSRKSSLDLSPKSFFDDDDDGEQNDTTTTTTATTTTHRSIASNGSVGLQNASHRDEDFQAAASSLFDARTSQQVASDTRHAYAHFARHHQPRAAAAYLSSTTGAMSRRYSGALMSILSLLGIGFSVASMTYFYPNMLEARGGVSLSVGGKGSRQPCASSIASGKSGLHNNNNSFRSTTSSTCNMIDDQLIAERPKLLDSIMANLNDYLLLVGLLMLYSLNIAFLLPAATMSLCYFRRLGLSLSYTLLVSAILGRILQLRRQSKLKRAPTGRGRRHRDDKAARAPPVVVEVQQQALESVDESVEVTFESLPHDLTLSECEFSASGYQHHQQQVATNIDNDANEAPPSQEVEREPEVTQQDNGEQSGNLLALPLVLIVTQFVASLIWLARQPPEPTLVHLAGGGGGCWHCASPVRSALLFHYEHLLALSLPASLLLLSWLAACELARRCSRHQLQYTQAIKRLLTSQPLSFTISNNPEYARLKRRQHALYLETRESKSLVMTTTLLLINWSLLIFLTVNQQARSSSMSSHHLAAHAAHAAHLVDPIVYLNLISGALIFLLLFVYRLHLFTGATPTPRSLLSLKKRAQYNSIKSSSAAGDATSTSGCLVFCCLPRLHKSRQSFAIDNSTMISHQNQPHKFNNTTARPEVTQGGGRPPVARVERLNLQQFNTYGTYSEAPESRVAPSGGQKKSKKSKIFSKKLQRRQSNGSIVSSKKLVSNGLMQTTQQCNSNHNNNDSDSDHHSLDPFDAISCSMSVTSNSTSQLQGTELYPIDCSIQLDTTGSGNNNHSAQAAQDSS